MTVQAAINICNFLRDYDEDFLEYLEGWSDCESREMAEEWRDEILHSLIKIVQEQAFD